MGTPNKSILLISARFSPGIVNDSYPKIRSLIPIIKGQEKGPALLKGDGKWDFYM
jgi:hypothetical protein